MPDGVVIDISPMRDLQQTISKLGIQLQFIVGSALYESMLDVMDRAKELCPVDTGALQGSGRVNPIQIRGGEITAVLDFGIEPYISYAIQQHEDLSLRHAPGKQAKFLEQAVLEWHENDGFWQVIDDVENYLGREIV